MSLDSIVNVTITTGTSAVSQTGFGVPLIAGYHNYFADVVREYDGSTGLADMIADGFGTSHPIYKAASYLLSQSPKVRTFKVGKLSTTGYQIVDITPVAVNNYAYSVTIGSETATYTSDGTATVAEITAGLTSAINALTGAFTATDNTTKITVTADAVNVDFVYKNYDKANLQFTDKSTAQASLSTDLAAIEVADDDWYCLLLARQCEADIEAAAAHIETKKKIFLCNSPDYGIISSSTTDVASDLQASNYARTALVYHAAFGEHAAAAWAGIGLNLDPGSETWKFEQPAGVTVNTLTSAQKSKIEDKSANYLIEIAGNNVMIEGWTASGEFIDVTRFVDWMQSRIQEEVFGALINNKKIPFTNAGIALIKGKILGVLREGVRVGGLSDDPAPAVFAPDAADVSSVNKAARNLPDVSFTATLAGAVHSVTITGTVSV
jgi:hypothetical protein